jgi:hypothetical protein
MYDLMSSSSEEKGFLFVALRSYSGIGESVYICGRASIPTFYCQTGFFSFFWMIGLALQAGYR